MEVQRHFGKQIMQQAYHQARFELSENRTMTDAASAPQQPKNPLHGLTLEAIVRALEANYGWEELGQRIPVRCFTQDPSVSSSLKFLRKTPWAREKVEGLYLFMLREKRRYEGR
jgi:uncharacterized protein (DUF2132 family)